MTTKKCPYYLVSSREEFDLAVAELGGIEAGKPTEPLYGFPMIVGREHGFGIFQQKGTTDPMSPYEDLVYELTTLQLPMTPQQRTDRRAANTATIDRILNGRKMGELPLLEQREIFQIGMECIALEMGAPAESIVHHKPLKVNMGDPFDCEHFADGEWHKVTIARTIYDYYRPIGEYPHKMEAFFADLCDPSRFRNFIYR